jgi:urea transporter
LAQNQEPPMRFASEMISEYKIALLSFSFSINTWLVFFASSNLSLNFLASAKEVVIVNKRTG